MFVRTLPDVLRLLVALKPEQEGGSRTMVTSGAQHAEARWYDVRIYACTVEYARTSKKGTPSPQLRVAASPTDRFQPWAHVKAPVERHKMDPEIQAFTDQLSFCLNAAFHAVTLQAPTTYMPTAIAYVLRPPATFKSHKPAPSSLSPFSQQPQLSNSVTASTHARTAQGLLADYV